MSPPTSTLPPFWQAGVGKLKITLPRLPLLQETGSDPKSQSLHRNKNLNTEGNKHMKRSSTSHITRKMQFKTAMRYYYIPIRMVKIWNTNTTKCWWGCGATGTLIHFWWQWKMVQPRWKTVGWFLTKLLPYDPTIALLGIYPKKLKTYPHKNLHMDILWKHPRCPSVLEWIYSFFK